METQTKQKRKSVCLAYFGDGKFLGWYADSFGSVREDEPKVYGYTPAQMETLTKNFRYKLSKLTEKSTLGEKVLGLDILDRSLNSDKKELSQYKEVELRVVECPEYDGENPIFNKVAYEQLSKEHTEKLFAHLKEKGLDGEFSSARVVAVREFEKENPSPKCDNWVYADYKKVKVWAKNEPSEFLETITSK